MLDDEVWSVKWDGQTDEFTVDPYTWSADSIENVEIVQTKIKNIKPSIKDVTLIINNDPEKRFSLEQTILAKKQGKHFFSTTGVLENGDSVFVINSDNTFNEILVESITLIPAFNTRFALNVALPEKYVLAPVKFKLPDSVLESVF